MLLGVSPGTSGGKGNECTAGGKGNEYTDGGKGNECIDHLVEKTMNVLLLLSQTPHVKTDETCESNDVGLFNSRSHMRNAITYFEIMLPRLSAHDVPVFVTRMDVMLQCCMTARQTAGDLSDQDSYTQACGSLLTLATCKMEIEQEATRQHVGDHGSGHQFREAK